MITVEAGDTSLRGSCLRYVRASVDDVDCGRWDDDLAAAEEPVARAWLAYMDADGWKDADGAERPTLDEVLSNAMASDWLVYASDEQKDELVKHLEEVLKAPTD